MKIYIASSWKNQHAVEMLTYLLRKEEHEIFSFVENNYGEGHSSTKSVPFEDWIKTEQADKSFAYDTKWAMRADLIVYIGPSGKDAAAELGMAFASGKVIFGLYAKGEDFGLMRKMIHWFERFPDLLKAIEDYNN